MADPYDGLFKVGFLVEPSFWGWLRWFRPGKCCYCGKWGWWIMRSEGAHEECWLETQNEL